MTIPSSRINWANTEQLRSDVARLLEPFPDTKTFLNNFVDRFDDIQFPSSSVCRPFIEAAAALYNAEHLNTPLAPFSTALIGTVEGARYRDNLLALYAKAADRQFTIDALHGTLINSFLGLIEHLPAIAFGEHDAAGTTISLFETINVPQAIMDVTLPFFDEQLKDTGLFSGIRSQLAQNQLEASNNNPKKLVSPEDFDGTPREKIRAYLKHTPLEAMFCSKIVFHIPHVTRYEHTHILGGSGHGKTQLLQHLILADLHDEASPALIVIDSQGEMLRKIERLKLFAGAMADKLIIIDPEDVAFPPALNMFDTTNARLAGYSLVHREQIEAGVIELYNYIFAAIAAEMTSRQSTAFAFVTRLLLSVPGSSIHTLRELMEDTAQSVSQSKFSEHIKNLDLTSQAYFENQFFTKRYSDLRQQIARRLYGVLSVPSFDRMFSSKHNKLDMFEAMQAGKVVLVNTSKALLKSDASALFGRYIIALAVKAAFERVTTQDRRPAFLFIDEAGEYFDENIETLLSQARKFNLGVVVAHQHLDQLSTGLRSSIAANTSIKLAGGISDRDARAIAPDMRTTADFIGSTIKHQHSTEFACFVRNHTNSAVRLEIPFGSLEGAPQMSEDEYRGIIARNRERYSMISTAPALQLTQETEQSQNQTSRTTRTDPDDISTDAASKW